MKINNIKISGWRSFDENGVELKDLKKNNILIGKNNSGKSNMSKYFMYIKEVAEDLRSKSRPQYLKYHEYEKLIEESDTWAWLNTEIQCEIDIDISNSEIESKLHHVSGITLHARHFNGNQHNLYVTAKGKKLLNYPKSQNPQAFNAASHEYVNLVKTVHGISDSETLWDSFFDSLVFIDPIRHYGRNSDSDASYYFDGAKIISSLIAVKVRDRKEWIEYKKNILSWITSISNEKVTSIEIIEGTNEFTLELTRGSEQISCSLEQLGTGIAQAVMLLSHLFLHRNKNLNVFIDEPESNLHPDAVVKVIDIFDEHFPIHTFFITTHSSALIDQVESHWSINRFNLHPSNSTSILPCVNVTQKRELLDDLGIRASQLLQSNLVIWVEGPSDAVYLKKWIGDFSNGKFIEGKHYSFIFYGGSNLSTHSILDEKNGLVDFLATSRYVVIFCDTDCKDQKSYDDHDFKGRVTKTIKRLSDLNKSETGHHRNLEDFVYIWLTDGRETENYVPTRIFSSVLQEAPFKKEYLEGTDKKRIDLCVDGDLLKNTKLDLFSSFDQTYSQIFKRADGVELTHADKQKIALKYSGAKVDISKAVVEQWKNEDYTEELKNKLEKVVGMIAQSSGLDLVPMWESVLFPLENSQSTEQQVDYPALFSKKLKLHQ